VLFQIHLMVGAMASVYIVLISISIVVWQKELYKIVPVEWLVNEACRPLACRWRSNTGPTSI
jgi:hypothetical protein